MTARAFRNIPTAQESGANHEYPHHDCRNQNQQRDVADPESHYRIYATGPNAKNCAREQAERISFATGG
jgi:hypothetical protein